eukprot:2172248-Amphidinium_carterae.1
MLGICPHSHKPLSSRGMLRTKTNTSQVENGRTWHGGCTPSGGALAQPLMLSANRSCCQRTSD